MLIRQDFSEQDKLPPRLFMEQIMDGVVKVYCFLWDRKNEQNKFIMTWKDLSSYYNKNNFRSSLRKLNNESLLSYEESADGVSVDLVGWDEVASEC